MLIVNILKIYQLLFKCLLPDGCLRESPDLDVYSCDGVKEGLPVVDTMITMFSKYLMSFAKNIFLIKTVLQPNYL